MFRKSKVSHPQNVGNVGNVMEYYSFSPNPLNVVMYVILVMLRNISLISEFCSENHIDNNQNTSLAAKGALAHRLQRRTTCKIQNGRQGAPKWPPGSGKGFDPRLLVVPTKFAK